MDAGQIRSLQPRLMEYLAGFADCFGRRDTREHLSVFVRGQLSDLAEKRQMLARVSATKAISKPRQIFRQPWLQAPNLSSVHAENLLGVMRSPQGSQISPIYAISNVAL